MNIDTPHITHIPLLRNLWHEAFGDTEEFLNTFYVTAFSLDRCRCITVDGEIAAALYWFDCLHKGKNIAYLYAVATAEMYRGQGICHRLINDTHLHLEKQGYEGIILVPGSKALFRLYESMGYQTCSYIHEFCCNKTTKEIQLYRISKEEYARVRRLLLPEGGVIQENENLDFLETLANLYAGPGFVLAAHGESDTLYGLELLGDTTSISGILHVLGYAKGIFRTLGGDKPFAMYYPLGDSKLLPPTYFGLAFD